MTTALTETPKVILDRLAEEDDRPFSKIRPETRFRCVAAFGALFVAGAIAIWVAWIVGPDFIPTPKGASALPSITHFWVVGFQAASTVASAVTVLWIVVRCVRQRRVVFDAIVVLGGITMYIQDPLINWLSPVFTYNSHLANHGSWSLDIPGWVSPLGDRLPEPYLFIGIAYIWMTMLAAILASNAMRCMTRRDPSASKLKIFATGYVAMVIFDFVFEVPWVHAGLYAYPGAIRWLSIWPGHSYQFPIYEAILFPLVWTSSGYLRFSADATGRSFIQRGSNAIKRDGLRILMSVLAVAAFMNVAEIVLYDVPMAALTSYGGPWPTMPTYLQDGLCGAGTHIPCPGPHAPISIR